MLPHHFAAAKPANRRPQGNCRIKIATSRLLVESLNRVRDRQSRACGVWRILTLSQWPRGHYVFLHLTTSDDTITGTSGDDTVNATSASALNPGDHLDGGAGYDTLGLFGSGTFDLSTLAQFTGFEAVNLTNTTGGASNLVLRDGADLM